MSQISTISFVVGALLLIWALAVRRSRSDSLVLAMNGILIIGSELRPMIESNSLGLPPISPSMSSTVALVMLVASAVAVLLLLVRGFLSQLPWYHRIGMGIAGVLLAIPIVVILGMMGLYALLGARVI